MASPLTKLAIVITVATAGAGCGKNGDYRERYLKLQEQHGKEIARLVAQREKENKNYEWRLSLYETRLNALRKKLGLKEDLTGEKEAKEGSQPEQLPAGGGKISEDEMAQAGEEPETVPATESREQPTPPETEKLLEGFVQDYASHIEAGRREQFKKDFSKYIAGLREQSPGATDFQRKERMLEGLQQRLSATADDSERVELNRRIEKIQNASDEDLGSVLAYYQRLDDIRDLKILMDEYNISREELRERGVEPPPRDTWAPDAKEIAFNLRNFVSSYEPLTSPEQREQYRRDFEKYLNDLTTRPTDEQVLQRKDQMLAELEERVKTASEEERSRLERRIRNLENSGIAELRRWAQSNKLREFNQLVEKYDLPRDELRQAGVLLFRGRNPTRR